MTYYLHLASDDKALEIGTALCIRPQFQLSWLKKFIPSKSSIY